MIYYKVPALLSQLPISNPHSFLVENELYTEKELTRRGIDNLKPKMQKLEISSRKTYFFFVARFEKTL